jgi:hypothetical protein
VFMRLLEFGRRESELAGAGLVDDESDRAFDRGGNPVDDDRVYDWRVDMEWDPVQRTQARCSVFSVRAPVSWERLPETPKPTRGPTVTPTLKRGSAKMSAFAAVVVRLVLAAMRVPWS